MNKFTLSLIALGALSSSALAANFQDSPLLAGSNLSAGRNTATTDTTIENMIETLNPSLGVQIKSQMSDPVDGGSHLELRGNAHDPSSQLASANEEQAIPTVRATVGDSAIEIYFNPVVPSTYSQQSARAQALSGFLAEQMKSGSSYTLIYDHPDMGSWSSKDVQVSNSKDNSTVSLEAFCDSLIK